MAFRSLGQFLALSVPLAAARPYSGSAGVSLLSPRQDTGSLPRPELGSIPYGTDIRACNVAGQVALTFDDGPGPFTSQLLDILDRNGVHATFFLCGNNGQDDISTPGSAWPALVQRMHAAGHHIGSHTYTHPDLSTLSPADQKADIVENERALASILGFFPTYLRPPYTSCGESCSATLLELGYHEANYNIDTLDWQGDYDAARSRFTAALAGSNPASAGFISLAHDIHERTVTELAQFLIDETRAAGYQLVTMGECLGDPVANWYRDPTTGGSWMG